MIKFDMPKDYYSKKYDMTIKSYLSANDIIEIAEVALEVENSLAQELCIAVNVINACTDKEVSLELNDEEVNGILFSGLWDEVKQHVDNLCMVYEYIEDKQSIEYAISTFFNNTLPDFLDRIEGKMDEYVKHMPDEKGWETIVKEMPKSLGNVLDIVKKDGNAEIISGAMKMGEK